MIVSRRNMGEAASADVVSRPPASDTLLFGGPYGPIHLPAPNRCHMVAIISAPTFTGDVAIRLGTGN